MTRDRTREPVPGASSDGNPLEEREGKGTVLQGGERGLQGCRRERVTDEKAWREALGDDWFFPDVTEKVVSKGIRGFILTGLPEPKKPEPGD
jgi:hypothetical protein